MCCDTKRSLFVWVAVHNPNSITVVGITPTAPRFTVSEHYQLIWCNVFFLEVREDKPTPQKLYVSLGFIAIDRREKYYQPDGVAAIVMRLDLEGQK